MILKKRVFWIATFVILAAVIIVLGVSYFSGRQATEYDGTLVKSYLEFPSLI
jgi:hypothetical protein